MELLSTNSPLEWLQKENAKLKKAVTKNYHLVLLRNWLFIIGPISIGIAIGFATVLSTGYIAISGTLAQSASVDSLVTTMIAPSITINGLFITFIPVITFFLSEIEASERESTKKLKKLEQKSKVGKKSIGNCRIGLSMNKCFFIISELGF